MQAARMAHDEEENQRRREAEKKRYVIFIQTKIYTDIHVEKLVYRN